MKLSINILTWNTWPTLHDTLHLLTKELEGIESEIIIVDNGSVDGCQDVATIKNSDNLGISKGKNQGIDASKGEYIMLIDGDIIPVPNCIRLLLEYMEANKDCDAMGFPPNKFSNMRNKHQEKYHEDYCHKLVNIHIHPGHCVYFGMYRRTVFERGVRFDEDYGVGYGYEDLDTYMQMKKLGINQWVAHINAIAGKYFHAVNSSIQQSRTGPDGKKYGMGFQTYMSSQFRRAKLFREKWGDKLLPVC